MWVWTAGLHGTYWQKTVKAGQYGCPIYTFLMLTWAFQNLLSIMFVALFIKYVHISNSNKCEKAMPFFWQVIFVSTILATAYIYFFLIVALFLKKRNRPSWIYMIVGQCLFNLGEKLSLCFQKLEKKSTNSTKCFGK